METHRALDLIEKLEATLARMYLDLHEKFEDDDMLAAFFYQMHLEEKAHVNIARMQKRMVHGEKESFPSVDIDAAQINKVIDIADSVAKMSKDRIKDILRQIYLMESSSAELYVFTALSKTNREMRELLLNLGSGFSDHLGKVEAMMTRMGLEFEKVEGSKMRHPRILYPHSVRVNNSLTMKALDISESGMFIMTDRKLPVGSAMTLTFKVPNKTIETRAVVYFSDDSKGIGVGFTDMKEEDRQALRNFVHNALKNEMKKEAPVLLVSSKDSAAGNLKMFMSLLLEEGYAVTYTKGFIEAVLFMNSHAADMGSVVVAIDSGEDENMKILQYMRENDKLGRVKTVVISNNHAPEFKQAILAQGAKAFMSRMDTTPRDLSARIEAINRK